MARATRAWASGRSASGEGLVCQSWAGGRPSSPSPEGQDPRSRCSPRGWWRRFVGAASDATVPPGDPPRGWWGTADVPLSAQRGRGRWSPAAPRGWRGTDAGELSDGPPRLSWLIAPAPVIGDRPGRPARPGSWRSTRRAAGGLPAFGWPAPMGLRTPGSCRVGSRRGRRVRGVRCRNRCR